MSRIKMGVKVQDVISGLTGIVTGFCTYITGCDQWLVQPRAENGSKPDATWIDDARLSVVSDEAITLPGGEESPPGFDKAPPVR